jgi:hypothetical protein
MALEEVQEGKANGTTLNGLDNRRKFAKPGEPIAQGRVRNLKIDGDLGNAVGRVFVKSVVLCGHCDDTVRRPSRFTVTIYTITSVLARVAFLIGVLQSVHFL